MIKIFEQFSYIISLIIVISLIIYIINEYKDKQKEKKQNPIPQNIQSEKITKNELQNPEILPYEKKMLLTKAEYSFYLKLKEECDKNNLLICPKVRMEDFISVTDKKNHLKYRGYIKARHIDFLICDNKLHIKAGIELDDNTHKQEKIKQVDNLKEKIFKQISLPLFRIKMSDGYYQEQIQKIINTLLQPNINKEDEIKTP